MLLWKGIRRLISSETASCFNPCSLGCCSERFFPNQSRYSNCSFNPCSLGCCSERRKTWKTGSQTVGFNPCSLGCCSERFLYPSRLKIHYSFNPCSLGCCSESLNLWRTGSSEKEFQSLFSWMLLWKSWSTIRSRSWKSVSILVLLDVALKECCRNKHPIRIGGFQSLFSWMLLWKAAFFCRFSSVSRGKNPFRILLVLDPKLFFPS